MKRLSTPLQTLLIIIFLVFLVSDCKKPERVIKVLTLDIVSQDITHDQVILKGEIIDIGDNQAEDHGILIRNSSAFATGFTELSRGAKYDEGVFTAVFYEPVPSSTYEYKAYARSGTNIIHGETKTFSSLAITVPVLTSTEASDITVSGATAGGNITSDGGSEILDRGICWNTSGSPTISDGFISDETTGAGSYTTNFDGLESFTTYHLKAYATNSAGTGYGNELSFATLFEVITGTLTDSRDGKTYNWTQIGDQKWMAENLAYLPQVNLSSLSGAFWTLYYVYDHQSEDVSEAISTDNYSQYGVLYNWNAAMNNSVSNNDNPGAIQGVCPDGWHIPSEVEWQVMESYLGMSETDLEIEGEDLRGDIGGMLKEEGTTHWLNTNIGASNLTHFNALPGGQLDAKDTESFINLGTRGYWWSSTIKFDESYDSWSRSLRNNNTAIGRNAEFIASGLSVRCIEGQGANMAVVETNPAENITQTGVTLSGLVSDDKHGYVTERGIFWGTADEPPQHNGTKVIVGTDVGTFSTELTGLSAGQTYYYCAFATNIAGQSYGGIASFTTLTPTLATLTTIDASNITATSAISGGNISDDGGSEVFDRGVCWSTSTGPDINDSFILDGNNGIGTFNCTINNLLAGTIYYLRAFATNSQGTAYGNEIEFTTHASLKTVAISNILTSSASSGGENISIGSLTLTEKGICFGTSTNPTVSDTKLIYDDGSSGENAFAVDITGLDEGTTYHVRAYLITNTGTFYGEDLSFPTEAMAAVTTYGITNVTMNSAVSGGNVTSPGSGIVSERGVCWNTGGGPLISDFRTSDGGGTGEFTSILTGLSSGTTYYLKAYASNELGTAYGDELIFITYNGQVSDFDGNDYYTVQIGSQIWMAENLQTTHYADGSSLTDGTGVGDIAGDFSTKYYFASDDDESNVAIYGRLYSWAGVMNGSLGSSANPSGVQGVCPDGWHVPSDSEWKELETYLGISTVDADLSGWRGENEGDNLKSTTGWTNEGNGSNDTGFTGLPGGSRYTDGVFYILGDYSGTWSATEATEFSTNYAWYRCLYWENSGIYRYSNYKSEGRSVRCVKD